MKWYISLGLMLAVAVGFYFHVLTVDPLSVVILMVMLLNNHNLIRRQEQTAELIKKSHDVTATNQKVTLDALKQIRADLRKL
jgi:hypothetical protein